VGFKCKITGCSDATSNFIVHKVLEGMQRLKNRADTRLPITPDILQRIVSILPSICFNIHENKLFKVAFTLAYWGQAPFIMEDPKIQTDEKPEMIDHLYII
jgi:hypothetical protein